MHSDQRAPLKIRRALFSVSDKTGIVELARVLVNHGTELVATGKTAQVLIDAGLSVVPIEKISGSPEAFQGRMKTLSFGVCSGILFRRRDDSDEADRQKLGIDPIDCVVVNFYPFEKAARWEGITRQQLVEEIDIGGPTLVRAAAKNAPDVLVLTDPVQYGEVINELQGPGAISQKLAQQCAAEAWDRVLAYDQAIAERFGKKNRPTRTASLERIELKYGENPHQKAWIEIEDGSPIRWDHPLTAQPFSYNNILDLSGAYALASDLHQLADGAATGVVVVKHNNPCGVALIPKSISGAQKLALIRAWEGDPVSAFGGVVTFTDGLTAESAAWLGERFVEVVAAPGLQNGTLVLKALAVKRKNLKAASIVRFGEVPPQQTVTLPGGRLQQTTDAGMGPNGILGEPLKCVTQRAWPEEKSRLARFGIAVSRALKSNAIAIVREIPDVPGAFQLIGAGQGQPNRVDAFEKLALPRAQAVLRAAGGRLSDCVLVSDAFFPFRDTIDAAHAAGIRHIVQPGGSMRDADSIAACDEHNMSMVFTGIRHFRH